MINWMCASMLGQGQTLQAANQAKHYERVSRGLYNAKRPQSKQHFVMCTGTV